MASVDDFSRNTPNARRQLEVGRVRVDSQELASKLILYTFLSCLLVRGISVSVVVLIDLYCQLQSGQIQVNAVGGNALQNSQGIMTCISIS